MKRKRPLDWPLKKLSGSQSRSPNDSKKKLRALPPRSNVPSKRRRSSALRQKRKPNASLPRRRKQSVIGEVIIWPNYLISRMIWSDTEKILVCFLTATISTLI